MTDFQSFVQKRLTYSLVWTTAAKVTTCLLQIVSIPIAVKHLGVSGYAAFAAIYALSLAPQAFVMRHGPALTGPSAILFAEGRWETIRQRLWSSVIPSGISAAIAGLVFGILFQFGLLDIPGALKEIPSGALLLTLAILVVVNLTNTWVLVFDEVQAAFQETHVQGIRVTLGNIVALLATFFLVPLWPSLLVYAMAITLPPLLFRLANVGLMLKRFPQLMPKREVEISEMMRETFRARLLFTLVVGIGTYASFRIPVLAAATYLSVEATASISIINQFVLVGYVFGSILSYSFVPAINASVAGGNLAWIYRITRRLEYLLVIASVAGTAAFCLLGPIVHRYFVKEELQVPQSCLLYAGMYTALLVIENFYFLVAISFQASTRLSILYVVRTLITGLFAFLACKFDYAPGIWISGTVLTLVMTAIPYRSAVYQYIQLAASNGETEKVAVAQRA